MEERKDTGRDTGWEGEEGCEICRNILLYSKVFAQRQEVFRKVSYNIWFNRARNNTTHISNNSDINDINRTSAELYSIYKGKNKAYQDSAGIFDGVAYRTLISGRKGKYPYAWMHTTDGLFLAISNAEIQKLRCSGTSQINLRK